MNTEEYELFARAVRACLRKHTFLSESDFEELAGAAAAMFCEKNRAGVPRYQTWDEGSGPREVWLVVMARMLAQAALRDFMRAVDRAKATEEAAVLEAVEVVSQDGQLAMRVRAALAALSPRQQALVTAASEQVPYAQVARDFDLKSPATARRHVMAAKQALRQSLARSGYSGQEDLP